MIDEWSIKSGLNFSACTGKVQDVDEESESCALTLLKARPAIAYQHAMGNFMISDAPKSDDVGFGYEDNVDCNLKLQQETITYSQSHLDSREL